MTRVLLLGGRGGGGEEVFVRDLAASPPEGVRYDLVLDHHESVPGARALTGREVAFNRLVHPRLWPLPGLRAYQVDPDVDLVHVHNAPVLLDLPRGRPVVCSVGGAGYPHYLESYLGWDASRIAHRYRRARRIYRFLGVRSEVATPEHIDAVVVFSDYAAGQLRRWGVPGEKIHVIPPGFQISPIAEGEPQGGPCTFLLAGRHPERKGADVAVTATRILERRGVDVRLVLVGDAAYPGMSDGSRVQGWGPVSRSRLFADFFSKVDVVLVPSRAEGFGFAAVEGMGHGKPVIVSRRDALPEIVGEAGLLATPGDPEELAQAMEALATDRGRALALGRAGRERFARIYARERVQVLWADLYRHLLGRR